MNNNFVARYKSEYNHTEKNDSAKIVPNSNFTFKPCKVSSSTKSSAERSYSSRLEKSQMREYNG